MLSQSPALMTGPEVDALHKKHPNAHIVDVIVYREACEAYNAGFNAVLNHDERSTPENRQAARNAGIESLVRAGFPENALEIGRNDYLQQGNVSNYIEQPARISREQKDALITLQAALSQATDSGLFDEMAAHAHPDRINAFCDDVGEFAQLNAPLKSSASREVQGSVEKIVNDDEEVVVKLADGCTLRSGVYDPYKEGALTSGEYVRLCDPDGEEVLYWDQEEWANDPALVMGAIMNAAAGLRVQRVDSPSQSADQTSAQTTPDLSGLGVDALTRELERRGLLVQLWSPDDFEFIGNEDEEAADLSGEVLDQIQQQAFEQCRRSLDEITTKRGNEHLGDWWAKNKKPILERIKVKDDSPSPGM